VGAPGGCITCLREPVLTGWPHGHVNVFKNFPGSDAAHTIGRFDKIVAGLSAMLAPENVHERERFGQLFGTNQETGAVDLPFSCRFLHVAFTLGGGNGCGCWLPTKVVVQASLDNVSTHAVTEISHPAFARVICFDCSGCNLRKRWRLVNSITMVQRWILRLGFSQVDRHVPAGVGSDSERVSSGIRSCC